MGTTFQETIELTKIDCGCCGASYAINERYRQQKYQEGGTWHCPYCQTSWGYSNNNENARLKKQVAELEQHKANLRAAKEAAEQEAEHFRKSRDITKGLLNRVKTRLKNGVCPCCNRTFANLHRHMQSKHPGFSIESEPPAVEQAKA